MRTSSFINKIHWPFILLLILISSIGIALLYSIADGQWNPWALRQSIRLSIGLILLFVVSQVNIKFWYQHAYHFYFFCIFLIVATLLFSRETAISVNNWFMMFYLVTVFIGTIYPIFTQVLFDTKISVGPPFYNTVIIPIVILFLFFITIHFWIKV